MRAKRKIMSGMAMGKFFIPTVFVTKESLKTVLGTVTASFVSTQQKSIEGNGRTMKCQVRARLRTLA